MILSGDTAATPALSTGIGDILNISQWASSWESQAVTYARLFLPSGWPELEDKMSQGGCHPQVAYEYAQKVLKRPLSAPIESWLMLESFDAQGTEYREKYFAFAASKQPQSTAGTASPPP